MAKQLGIMPLQGTLDNYTFYHSKDGFRVRKRTTLTAEKIATSPDFQRTRENNAEFSRATKGGKLLRFSVRSLVKKVKDGRMLSRLSTVMLRVVQADKTSDRGLRNIIDGEVGLLQDFEFNGNATLSATLGTPFRVSFDREKGEAVITIAPFIPANLVSAPVGTTHFQLFSALSAIDFEAETNETVFGGTEGMPYTMDSTKETILTMNIQGGSKHPVFILLGIEFMQEVNGKLYPLKNGAFSACSIIKVDSPV